MVGTISQSHITSYILDCLMVSAVLLVVVRQMLLSSTCWFFYLIETNLKRVIYLCF